MVGPIEGELFGMVLMGLAALGFVILPFVDNGKSKAWSRFATIFGLLILTGMILLSIWGALS